MALPGHYKVHFTDPTKVGATGHTGYLLIEPYTTDGSIHPLSSIPDENAIFTSTSLLLHGKGVPNYGERISENFVQLLENFASPIEPINPINGQLWYDTGISYQIIQGNINNNVSVADSVVVVGTANDVAIIQGVIDRPRINNDLTINEFAFMSVVSTVSQQSLAKSTNVQ